MPPRKKPLPKFKAIDSKDLPKTHRPTAAADTVDMITFQYSTGHGTKRRRVEAKEVTLDKREPSPASTSQPTAPQQPLRTELPSAGKRKRIRRDQRTQVGDISSLLSSSYM